MPELAVFFVHQQPLRDIANLGLQVGRVSWRATWYRSAMPGVQLLKSLGKAVDTPGRGCYAKRTDNVGAASVFSKSLCSSLPATGFLPHRAAFYPPSHLSYRRGRCSAAPWLDRRPNRVNATGSSATGNGHIGPNVISGAIVSADRGDANEDHGTHARLHRSELPYHF